MNRRSFLATSAALAVGLIAPRKGYAGVTVSNAVNISGQDSLNQVTIDGECTIAVNPNSGSPPQGLFAAAHFDNDTEIAWYSTNGGQTWCPSTLPPSGGDGYAKFDDAGVLYLAYISGSPYYCMLAISTNCGHTFTAYTVSTRHTDQPSVAIGPNYGTTGDAVWLTAEALDDNNDYCVFLWGAPASPLGSFQEYQVVNSLNGNFGGIAVGPNGEVAASYIKPDSGEGPTTIYIVCLPKGLQTPTMPPPSATAVLNTNVGGQVYLPAQPDRLVQNKVQLSWDRNYPGSPCGRLYAVYLDRPGFTPPSAYATSVYVIYSDNAGQSWYPAVRVSDTSNGSKFNPAIAVDQRTGYVCVTWYDCRGDAQQDPLGNKKAQIYGALSTTNGSTWSSNFPVATGLSNGTISPTNPPFDFGDFDTMDAANGYFWWAWSDNSGNPSDVTPGSTIQPAFCLAAAYITFT